MRALLPLLVLLGLATPALAQDAWSVLPIASRGVDEGAVETFRDLLISELGTRTGASFVDGKAPCGDVPCARQAGTELAAAVVVFGRISTLGEKLVITLTAVDVAGGRTMSQQRMSIDRVEDLESVAARMAEAVVSGKSVDDTAQLGAITHKEVKPDLRREGDSGLALRVGGVVPLSEPYSTPGFGVLVDVGFWYEARRFAIEPHLGYRTNAKDDDDQGFDALNLDIGTQYLLTDHDIAPFIGMGAGLRHVWSSETKREEVGRDIVVSTEKLSEDQAWGPGGYLRAGVLLFRTYSVRTTLSVEYDVTFVDLNDHQAPQAFNFAVGIIL